MNLVLRMKILPFWHSCFKNYNGPCAYMICVQYKAKLNPNLKYDFLFHFIHFNILVIKIVMVVLPT
jgi:hypothetical protein